MSKADSFCKPFHARIQWDVVVAGFQVAEVGRSWVLTSGQQTPVVVTYLLQASLCSQTRLTDTYASNTMHLLAKTSVTVTKIDLDGHVECSPSSWGAGIGDC